MLWGDVNFQLGLYWDKGKRMRGYLVILFYHPCTLYSFYLHCTRNSYLLCKVFDLMLPPSFHPDNFMLKGLVKSVPKNVLVLLI